MGRIEGGGGGGGGGGVTDHGDLTGLADDDHAQYSKITGVRSPQYLLLGSGALSTGVTDNNVNTVATVTFDPAKRYFLMLDNFRVSADAGSIYLDVEFDGTGTAPTGTAARNVRIQSTDAGTPVGAAVSTLIAARFCGTLGGRIHIWLDLPNKRFSSQAWMIGAAYDYWSMSSGLWTASVTNRVDLVINTGTVTAGKVYAYEEML